MKLTRACTYAIHAMSFLATQEMNKPLASHIITKAQGIPERFLVKVLRPLVTARLLMSLPGPNGGYCLSRPANKITLLEVIEAVDGPMVGKVPLSHEQGDVALDQKLESLCTEVAELGRKRLQKVTMNQLAKGTL